MNLINHISPTYCINCKSDNALVIVNKFGRRLPYNQAIDMIDRTNIEFDHMECSKCKAIYDIDWSYPDRLIRPVYNKMGYCKFLQVT